MFSLQDLIKYLGSAAIIYFLIKAFTHDKLNNTNISIIVICIMALIIFITMQNSSCSTKNKIEGYQSVNQYMVDSVYANPNNEESYHAILNKDNTYEDEDVRDFKDIMGIDKKMYEKMEQNEKKAMKKIKSKYQDEMVYTTTHPFNTVPLGTQLYGYTFLPPENWFRAYERPPICITDKVNKVQSVADPSIAGLLEFDTTTNIVGPKGIDHRYIKNVIHRGNN